jgi:hypothetical protein
MTCKQFTHSLNNFTMFNFFKKDPRKKLEKKYLQLMEEARDIQRSGNLKLYAQKIEEAQAVQRELEDLSAKKS